MFKKGTGLLVVALAALTIGASAQSAASQDDMSGQDMRSTAMAVAAPSAPVPGIMDNSSVRVSDLVPDRAYAANAAAAASQRQVGMQIAEEAIRRYRHWEPTGRIAFSLESLETSFARLPRIKLANGDRLVVPVRPDFVHVFGAMNAEASLPWRSNSRVKKQETRHS